MPIMMLLGLLIPLGVGVLALMELRTPPRRDVALVQPVAETAAEPAAVEISYSHDALAKADRLEIAAASSEPPAQPKPQPAPVDEHIAPPVSPLVSPPEDVSVGAVEPPRVIKQPRHAPKPRKVAAAVLPKPKPKATDTKASDIKRTIVSERSKGAGDTGSCRLAAFGGLRKALNSADCEI